MFRRFSPSILQAPQKNFGTIRSPSITTSNSSPFCSSLVIPAASLFSFQLSHFWLLESAFFFFFRHNTLFFYTVSTVTKFKVVLPHTATRCRTSSTAGVLTAVHRRHNLVLLTGGDKQIRQFTRKHVLYLQKHNKCTASIFHLDLLSPFGKP